MCRTCDGQSDTVILATWNSRVACAGAIRYDGPLRGRLNIRVSSKYALQLWPSLNAQLLAALIFALFRAFLFSIVSAYNMATFGPLSMY